MCSAEPHTQTLQAVSINVSNCRLRLVTRSSVHIDGMVGCFKLAHEAALPLAIAAWLNNISNSVQSLQAIISDSQLRGAY
jgi:hypothetical protein